MSTRSGHLDEPGDISAPKGSRLWCVALIRMVKSDISKLEFEARTIGDRLAGLKDTKAWEALDAMSWDMLLHEELGIDADLAEQLMQAKPGTTVGDIFHRCQEVRDMPELPDKPKPGTADNISGSSGGTDLTYTLRRLHRDHRELFDKVEAGEVSANAAAIEAGFRKKQITVPVGDCAAVARRLLKHYSKDELITAINETSDA